MMDSSEITINDVAKAAGVSVSTVSRILNGKTDVAKATRERVQRIIDDLGYAPHAQAQRLRAGKTRNLALLFPILHSTMPRYNALEMEFIVGAAAASGDQNFLFNLITRPVNRHELLSLYRSSQVDGLVLMQIELNDWRVELLRGQYPFVMIGQCADNTGLSFIDLDFTGSVLTAFEHLVQLGHRSIGFLTLPVHLREEGFGPAVRMWTGYERALEQYALSPLYREVDYNGQEVFQATMDMLDAQPDITAIVTTHELGSQGILQAARAHGRSVPGDLSLIALMTEQISDLHAPPITYVDFPSYTMGYQALNILIRVLEEVRAEPEQILVPPRLVVCETTAPLMR
jgi:DNA-binding LacI/PurR family transcriptional regulator